MEIYDLCFQKAVGLIKEYPTCDKLILSLAQVFYGYLYMFEVAEKEEYMKKIFGWFELAASSTDTVVASQAQASLCQIYMQNEQYDKAQQLLDHIPPLGYDKRIMQASLYAKSGKEEDAYKIYEQILYQAANEIANAVQLIVNQLCKEKKFELASQYAKVGKEAANLLELGDYIASTPEMLVAVAKEDKEESIRVIESMAEHIDDIAAFQNSWLYSHMEFKEMTNLKELKQMIKNSLESDQDLNFLRNEQGYQRILRKLDLR